VLEWIDMPQSQGFVGSVVGAFLSRPPRDKIENAAQIAIDCIPLSARLALLPRISNPQQILSQWIGSYTVHLPAPMLSLGVTLAKSTNAFLRSSSLQNHSF
jgi:hypothetical protein